jgi:3'5'-cyclic nucleotide phosphodiesterase
LLIGWALLASPHAQQAMKASCGIQQQQEEEAEEELVETRTSHDDKTAAGTTQVEDSKSMDLEEVTTNATYATATATPSACATSSFSEAEGGYNFCETFQIPQDTLCAFLRAMENEYNSENPYHNEIHGADVVQTAHALLQMNKVVVTTTASPPPPETTTTTTTTTVTITSMEEEEEEESGGNMNGALPPPPLSPTDDEFTDDVVVEEELLQLTDLERFAYLLAAVVHDVGHPGRNNSFQINRQTLLALEYNDLSVLENMHASKAFRRLFQVTDVALPNATTPTKTKTTPGRRGSQPAPLASPTSRMAAFLASGKGATFASRAASMGDIGTADDPSFHEPYNFLRNMDPESVTKVRKMTIEAVLHTDMSKHFVTVSKMKGLILSTVQQQLQQEQQQQQQLLQNRNQNQNTETRKNDTDNPELSMVGGNAPPPQYIASLLGDGNPWQVLCFMLHLADISNPAKPQPMLTEWTDRCLEEFFAQGDEEAKLGLTISPNCNRKSTHRADSQIGFIKFVILPAYEVLAELIPDVGDEVLPIIEANLLYWTDLKTKEDNSVAIKAAAARAELAIIEKSRTPQIMQRKQQLQERASMIQAHAMENNNNKNAKGGEGQTAAVAATASDFLSKFKRSKAPAPSTS